MLEASGRGCYRDNADDAKYAPFWDEVRQLGLTVLWHVAPLGLPSTEAYVDQLHRMYKVLERHPGIPAILVQAYPLAHFGRDGQYDLPQVAYELAKLPDFLLEIAYPISYGSKWEYPYPQVWPLISQLYDWFGPERLGVAAKDESEFLPNVKTLRSQGYDVVMGGNVGIVVPGATPKEIIDTLDGVIKKNVAAEELRKKMNEMGIAVRYMGPAEFGALWDEMEIQVRPLLEEAKKRQQ